ncbi:MAG: PQQ-binding-like beta-propeller repeat protein [Burkholderiales bacterium]|nr:MAG: PQQ-binding-like beta-propeller repeat protein [Burkholderiales bacterium]
MTTTRSTPRRIRSRPGLRLAATTLLTAVTVVAAQANTTDLASLPLITSAPQVVKPNLMFILDDSGSMDDSFTPEDAENFAGRYGFASSQCNGVYYNPALLYTPPVKVGSDGSVTSYPNASFSGAWTDGFAGSGSVNLGNSFTGYTSSTSATGTAAYYYRYSGSQTTEAKKNYVNTSSTFYLECNSSIGSSPGNGVFTKVTVSSSSGTGPAGADERTNFANWYSYYRTRMLLMKTATGRAFQNIGNKFRIGYMSINNNAGNSLLNISDFDNTQKFAWYSKLYGARTGGYTPLRQALSDAGRIYANKVSTLNGVSVTDPVQYSCQKNFTLLSTDGYWNSNAGYQLDGVTAVGSPDSPQPRPYNDGGSVANVYTATIWFTANNRNDNVSSIRFNGSEILSQTATAGWGASGSWLASDVVTKINACNSAASGRCTVAGYSAVRSGNRMTITAPATAGAISGSPTVTVGGTANATVTAFSGSTVTIGGVSDTLADVAQYYYQTDLRSAALGNETGALGTSVSPNNVLPGGDDDATWQHMTTFTLGLGVRGRMIYSPTYKTDTAGDYFDVSQGSTASSSVCIWQPAGTACTWPIPASGEPENIDDLWHAAVNGRGTYFSARDPASLTAGLNGALQTAIAMTADSAAATTSNPNVTAGDNYMFSSTFRSSEWYGELEMRQIDTSTGAIGSTPMWTAASLLDANTSRRIYTFDDNPSSTTKLKEFIWGNLTSTERDNFTKNYIGSTASPILSQFCASGPICLSSSDQSSASGEPLVNFIRGLREKEGPPEDTSKYFRQRTRVLGDIVNSEAVYVKQPLYEYVDSGYSTFKTSNASRTPVVYVGANDGMLHAFDAATGRELWAYVPKLLFPKLYLLADKLYTTNHQYYVDGSPTVGDVYFGGAWHTILVGGFNSGGRGYYALDITNPANPKALWEFTDANMGYSYGRPEITKLANGTWVALLTSGYNNVSPGNGQGYLYAVDVSNGTAIRTIGTGVGSATSGVSDVCTTAPCPSGLAQFRAWVENTRYDNTATKVYGGDLFGNVWRFDINDTIGPSGYEAQALATLRGPGSPANVQSLTAKPELGRVSNYPVIYVGTGRYLGASDLSDLSVQSIYAIKDTGGTTTSGSLYDSPRSDLSSTGFVQQTLTGGTCGTSAYCVAGSTIRTGSTNAVDFTTQKGWFVDLPGVAERATTDPALALGTLAVTTNLLEPTACTLGGKSFLNYFDYRTGQAVSTAGGLVSVSLGNALAARPVQLRFADGTVRSLVRMSDNSWQIVQTPIPPSPGGIRRLSWRELTTQ